MESSAEDFLPLEKENKHGEGYTKDTAESSNADSGKPPTAAQPQAVRFSSSNQEIEPSEPSESLKTTTTDIKHPTTNSGLSEDAQQQLKSLSLSLQKSRMHNFAFEPVSLPVSRVPSNESSSHPASREATDSRALSPLDSPSQLPMHSPPITPATTRSREAKPEYGEMSVEAFREKNDPSSTASSLPSSDQVSTRPTSVSGDSVMMPPPPQPRHVPKFSIGPTGDSLPASRDPSPDGRSSSGTTTPSTRPFAPAGEKDDPYARSKRPPQSRNLDNIDPRFIFGSAKDHRRSQNLTSTGPKNSSTSDVKLQVEQNRHSGIFGLGKEKLPNHLNDGSKHGSMSDLKRFFRLGHKSKRTPSPSSSLKSTKSGTQTPPHRQSQPAVPFADDHALENKYGKFGKVLGSGAGGSVRLLKRPADGTTFAVKQFRDRHPYETEKEYAKKVTAEFCIGSTLHHGNIIETMDIIHERGKWYEIMEFAPFDLFAIVMTGKMTREEVACSFLQILRGVAYLHSVGLAHRDLKLDNVVVNDKGIMKIIDFGSASVFRYPFENDIVLTSGIVGSDPYLAPEVYDLPKYDPQPTDIWSLAIIFACMSLRRFPWKAPRVSDSSYKLFVSPPSPGQPIGETGRHMSEPHAHPKSAPDLPSQKAQAEAEGGGGSPDASRNSTRDTEGGDKTQHHHHHHHNITNESAPADDRVAARSASQSEGTSSQTMTIKGPWRLLRLLPRETRSIIGRMLEVDPRKRAKLEEILKDPWVSETAVCVQEDGGKVVLADTHVHTLEPSSGEGPAPAASKK